MWRGSPGIARSPDKSEGIAYFYPIALAKPMISLKMSVIVIAGSGSHHRNRVATQFIPPPSDNNATGSTEDGRVPLGENIDAFVDPAT